MNTIIEETVVLFIIAIVVALLARKLRLPYTVGLVLTGIFIAFSHLNLQLNLTHELIFDVILPPLLFEAAINIHWKELRRDMLPVMSLAIIGIIIAAIFMAYSMSFLFGWPLPSALIFGVLIAATDPVAVIAMFKDNNIKGRVRLLVESESLFNDGVAAVLFAIVLAGTQVGAPVLGMQDIVVSLLRIIGGAICVGAVCGGISIIIAGRTQDHLIETALTVITAYGSFILAEHFQCSGVISTVIAGLIIGNIGFSEKQQNKIFTESGSSFQIDFWEFIAFMANSLIFLLIGLRISSLTFSTVGGVSLCWIIVLVLISRALAVYSICFTFFSTPWKISTGQQHILWWGGLRGALGAALALSLPDWVIFHNEIVIATFAIVAFSVIIQGITMPWLLKKEISSSAQ